MARLVFTNKDHNAYDPKKYRVSSATKQLQSSSIANISRRLFTRVIGVKLVWDWHRLKRNGGRIPMLLLREYWTFYYSMNQCEWIWMSGTVNCGVWFIVCGWRVGRFRVACAWKATQSGANANVIQLKFFLLFYYTVATPSTNCTVQQSCNAITYTILINIAIYQFLVDQCKHMASNSSFHMQCLFRNMLHRLHHLFKCWQFFSYFRYNAHWGWAALSPQTDYIDYIW